MLNQQFNVLCIRNSMQLPAMLIYQLIYTKFAKFLYVGSLEIYLLSRNDSLSDRHMLFMIHDSWWRYLMRGWTLETGQSLESLSSQCNNGTGWFSKMDKIHEIILFQHRDTIGGFQLHLRHFKYFKDKFILYFTFCLAW